MGLSVKGTGRKWKKKERNIRDGLRRAPGGKGSKVASSPSGICPCLREHPRTRERAAGLKPHPGQDLPTKAQPCQRLASRASKCPCA